MTEGVANSVLSRLTNQKLQIEAHLPLDPCCPCWLTSHSDSRLKTPVFSGATTNLVLHALAQARLLFFDPEILNKKTTKYKIHLILTQAHILLANCCHSISTSTWTNSELNDQRQLGIANPTCRPLSSLPWLSSIGTREGALPTGLPRHSTHPKSFSSIHKTTTARHPLVDARLRIGPFMLSNHQHRSRRVNTVIG